jgi:hypothetical protein
VDLILPSSLPSFALSGEDSPRARFVSSPAAQLGGFAEHIETAIAGNTLCQACFFISTKILGSVIAADVNHRLLLRFR